MRFPLAVFVATRATMWAGAVAVAVLLGSRAQHNQPAWAKPFLHEFGRVTDVWAQWDSADFIRIAQHGYGSVAGSAAFYPAYPAAIGVLGRLDGGHYVSAGIALSLVATLVAFVLLDELTVLIADRGAARRAVLYLALFPTTFFLLAVYSEALYLALTIGAFLLAERKRWLPAAVVVGLAMLTRAAGAALIPALCLLAWEQRRLRMALPRLAVVPLIFASFPLLLWAQTGDPLGFMRAEQGWGRTLSPAGPLGGLWEGARAAFAGIEQLVHGPGRIYWTNPHVTDLSPDRVAAQNLEQLAYLLVFLVLTVVAWQRVGHAYGAFAGLSLAIPLSEPAVAWPLLSMPRFTLAAFPLFIALAKTGTSRRARMTIVTASTVLLVVTLARWSLGWWVA